MKPRWIVACVVALLSSNTLADSEIYCEVSSHNFAWGPQYGGTVISPNGTVALFEYDFQHSPGDRADLFGEHWLAPTRAELAGRFRPGRRVAGTLCSDRRAWLRDQLEVVRTAGQSKIVDMQSRDGPTIETHCFEFEPGRDRATLVFLRKSGDTEGHSLSPSAPRLANWLRAVSEDARRRTELHAKEPGCIDDPPLVHEIYRDAVAEVRQRAMQELKATLQMHCEFAGRNSTLLEDEQGGNYDAPERLSIVFTHLDSAAHSGRGETFGYAYSVRIDATIAGLTLINTDAEKNRIADVVTIVPHRIGGREIYPAVKHEILLHDTGALAIRYTGQCKALSKAP